MRKRIYFVGASGTGKTTLAKHVERAHGLHRLNSAARATLKEFGLTSFSQLREDRELWGRFQSVVFTNQVAMEKAAEGHFVSDRCFDYAIYSALYATGAWQIARSPEFHRYLQDLRAHDDGAGVIFHVRPCRETFEASLKDGDRPEFIVWDDIMRFDGAIRYVLETNEIRSIPIDTPSLNDRKSLIDGLLHALPKR